MQIITWPESVLEQFLAYSFEVMPENTTYIIQETDKTTGQIVVGCIGYCKKNETTERSMCILNIWINSCHAIKIADYFFDTADIQSLKGYVIHENIFSTWKEANSVLFEYIEVYYNRISRHSANGWLNPAAFEQKYFEV